VLPGDRLLFVNGVRKEEMITELSRPGTLYIVVQRGASRTNKGAITMPRSQVDELPRIKYDGKRGEQACGICLQDWSEGEEALLLPCRHLFHPDCAGVWLTNHSTLCPLCNRVADHDPGTEVDLDSSLDLPEPAEEDELAGDEVHRPLVALVARSSSPSLPSGRVVEQPGLVGLIGTLLRGPQGCMG